MTRPERRLQNITAGMVLCLAFVQLSGPEKPADVCVVVSELFDAPRGRQVVDPAVSNVAEIHPMTREPAKAQRRAHARTFLVAGSQVEKCLVNF